MNDKVQEYIDKTLKEESDIWFSIAKESSKQHPNESVRQIIIRTVIKHFETKYPDVMGKLDVEIKKKKELAITTYSSVKDVDMRQTSAIPESLETRINQAFQKKNWHRFLSNEIQKEYDELGWFIKEFPRFVVPSLY